MKSNYTIIQLDWNKQRLMNIFLCKTVFNRGKDNWCLLGVREYLEYDGVWKARIGKEVETMMTKVSLS